VVKVTLEEGANNNDSLVNVAFYNSGAHIELGLVAQGSGSAFIPIWTPSSSSVSLSYRSLVMADPFCFLPFGKVQWCQFRTRYRTGDRSRH
jgi:hypothetical protein